MSAGIPADDRTMAPSNLPGELNDYIETILGLKDPFKIEECKSTELNVDPVLHLLFQADSLWNLGQTTEAEEVVSAQARPHEQYIEESHGNFAKGIEGLCAGSLSDALESFQDAAMSASSSLPKAFFTERAVNIAFWMACSGRMLEAAKVLEDHISNTPFAGGILSFAVHMNGDSVKAEQIAKTAIDKGFDDPWTVHAVAHALTSQERHRECAAWLRQHRNKCISCNAFMKGHVEFHLALCYVYLKDDPALNELIHGALWGTMPSGMQEDYWNAAGLLNILWKAEISGVVTAPQKEYSNYVDQALQNVTKALSGVNPGKSSVFSLCIFRFTSGSMRDDWKSVLVPSEVVLNERPNQVLARVATAISLFYHQETPDIKQAKEALITTVNEIDKLGASPEQREVIDDFVQMILK